MDSQNKISNFLFSFLRVVFCCILCIWVFRLGIDINSGSLSFSSFLNFISDCPDYYGSVVEFVNSNFSIVGSLDSANLPIFGTLFQLLSNVIKVAVYVFGCIGAGFSYLFYFVSFVFSI